MTRLGSTHPSSSAGPEGLVPTQDVEAVLARAAELDAASPSGPTGVPVEDVKLAAAEAGIEPRHVERAFQELRAARASPRRSPAAVALGVACVALVGGAWWRYFASHATASVPSHTSPEPPASAEPASAPPAAPSAGPVPAAPGTLPFTPLAGPRAREAAAGFHGDWQLVSWLSLGTERLEVPALRRPQTEAPAEAWEFSEAGRFRRTFGADLAVGGRWSIAGSVSRPEPVVWLGDLTWYLVALDDVTVSSDPLNPRGREWLLAARDGPQALFVYLGRSVDPSSGRQGGRFTIR
jgi:hypothetical protein